MEPNSGLHCGSATLTFGVLQLLFGITLLLVDIASIVVSANSYYGYYGYSLGAGFWGGIFFTICGTFGILAGRKLAPGTSAADRKCPLIAAMVMSILSSVNTFGLTIYFGVMVAEYDHLCQYRYNSSYRYFYCEAFRISVSFLTFVLLSFICALGQSIAAGINLCKLPPRVVTNTTYGQQQYPPGVVYVTAPPQQQYGQPQPFAQQPYPPQQGPPVYGQQQPYPAEQGKI